jgi:predicted cobalt transporter CbtA
MNELLDDRAAYNSLRAVQIIWALVCIYISTAVGLSLVAFRSQDSAAV